MSAAKRATPWELNQAEQLRRDGNTYFKKQLFGAAIDAYTEAITLCPNVFVYYTNRALCHRKRDDWVKVEHDCRRAIQLDTSSVKRLVKFNTNAHYMLGLALMKKEEYPEGIKELERALELGRGGDRKGYMVEEIWQEIAKAKYLEWEQASTARAWDLQNLKEACETALHESHDRLASVGDEESANQHLKHIESLHDVFNKVGENDVPSDVPDYLCCKITLDILRDPVITPRGITYEKAAILDHLHKVGKVDPITWERLDECDLIPNLGIKQAVEAFLSKNGWAYYNIN